MQVKQPSLEGYTFYIINWSTMIKSMISALICLFVATIQADCQTLLFNKGALISIKPNTEVCIHRGGLLNNTNGTIQHAGYLRVEGDLTNDHIIDNEGPSKILILHDFTNNQIFIPGNSWVNLYGGAQTIGGTDTTYFHTLEISGTGIKYLDSNIEVNNSLHLNNLEISTAEHSLTVSNADAGAITRTTGFVSSTGDGALYRTTNNKQNYLFPVGSSTQTPRYRPIVVHPDDSDQNVFGIRFANVNASDEGFDIQNVDSKIKSTNTAYYHRIYHTSGASLADFSFYPLPDDGNWNAVSYWDTKWQNIDNQIALQGGSITVENWEPEKYVPYILSEISGESIYIPNTFSPNGDGENDVFTVYANEQISSIKSMKVFDRWGSLLYEAENLTPNFDAGFWDGTYKGEKLGPGVFVFSLLATLTNGSDKQFNGSVTIVK